MIVQLLGFLALWLFFYNVATFQCSVNDISVYWNRLISMEIYWSDILLQMTKMIYKTFRTVSSYRIWASEQASKQSRGGRVNQPEIRTKGERSAECRRWKEYSPRGCFVVKFKAESPVMDCRWLLLRAAHGAASSLASQLTKAMLLINHFISVTALNARRACNTGSPLVFDVWRLAAPPCTLPIWPQLTMAVLHQISLVVTNILFIFHKRLPLCQR